MEQALEEARKAFKRGEVPIGALVVYEGRIIGTGYNQRETLQRSSAHAEMLAIDEANRFMGSWRLEECTLYVTLEPCPMCAGAAILSRVDRLVYGAKDNKNGVHVSGPDLFAGPFNHCVEVKGGVLAEESKALIQRFFRTLRK